MAQELLNLFNIAACFATELGAGAAKVVKAQMVDSR
jgi:hypothetical protein